MFNLKTNRPDYELDLFDIVKLFDDRWEETDCEVNVHSGPVISVEVVIEGRKYDYGNDWNLNEGEARMIKRYVKLCLYKAFAAHRGREMPWGSVTGVRPTKLAYEYLSHGGSPDGVADYLRKVYLVSPPKAEAVQTIVRVQRPYLAKAANGVNLYVNIPVCPTRCNYCSFPATTIDLAGKYLDEYAALLIKEIIETRAFIERGGKRILSAYIGGGTPAILSPSQIEKLVTAVGKSDELTFEAGREDCITVEKLDVLSGCGVDRICINPQSLNEKTMTRIGRRQSEKGFYTCYELARKYGFIINTDIIAGLDGETPEDFAYTADRIFALRPDNVTVHTLSKKRGSENAEKKLEDNGVRDMVDYGWSLFGKEYVPYYLYRQKYMLGGLENTGFSLPGKECLNNVTVMEETTPVMACGAGGISKRITGESIDRLANVKDLKLYVEQFDERLNEKFAFFSFGES